MDNLADRHSNGARLGELTKVGHFDHFGHMGPENGAGSPRPAAPINRRVGHSPPRVLGLGNLVGRLPKYFSQGIMEARDPMRYGDVLGHFRDAPPLKTPFRDPYGRGHMSGPTVSQKLPFGPVASYSSPPEGLSPGSPS